MCVYVCVQFTFCYLCCDGWFLGLNSLQSGLHKQYMKDLFVELCLTVPVRLSSLLPYLPMLMDPLVSALNGSQTLISQVRFFCDWRQFIECRYDDQVSATFASSRFYMVPAAKQFLCIGKNFWRFTLHCSTLSYKLVEMLKQLMKSWKL